jgi:transposase
LLAAKQLSAALAEAQQAVALWPNAVNPNVVLGNVLTEQGKGTLGELAKQFGVSEGWAKKFSSTRVQQLIATTGARLMYLPPYSPDFNPIEQAWSKIKQLLRSAKARSVEALERAVTEALRAITADNAAAWFAHCGYGLQ